MQDLKEEIINYSKIKELIHDQIMEKEHLLHSLQEAAKEVDLDNREVIKEVQQEINSTKAQLKFLMDDSLEERWGDEYYEEFISSISEEDLPKVLEQLRINELVVSLDTKVGTKFNMELEMANAISGNKVH